MEIVIRVSVSFQSAPLKNIALNFIRSEIYFTAVKRAVQKGNYVCAFKTCDLFKMLSRPYNTVTLAGIFITFKLTGQKNYNFFGVNCTPWKNIHREIYSTKTTPYGQFRQRAVVEGTMRIKGKLMTFCSLKV